MHATRQHKNLEIIFQEKNKCVFNILKHLFLLSVSVYSKNTSVNWDQGCTFNIEGILFIFEGKLTFTVSNEVSKRKAINVSDQKEKP